MHRLLPLGLLILPAAAAAQAPASPPARSLDDVVAEKGADLVAKDGRHGFVAGFYRQGQSRVIGQGRGSKRSKKQLGPDSVFEIGSISKVFTSLLLADMIEKGEVKLDDTVQSLLPVGEHMPRTDESEIRLRHLSNHHSGLPRLPSNLRPRNPMDPYAGYTAKLLYAFLEDHDLRREIGSKYEYSNLGAGLLGHVLARKGGKSYEALVVERICKPLQMSDTLITLRGSQKKRLARGHAPNGLPVANWDLAVLVGAGGWRSTGRDMVRLLTACIDGKNEAFARTLARSLATRREIGSGRAVALGWHIVGEGDKAIIWHNGGTGGYSSFAGYRLATRTGVVVLCNRARAASGTTPDSLGLLLLEHVEQHGLR